jgi:hypothetical protein
MEPKNHAAAPAIEPGVLSRLRRLDRNLRVTWSPLALDVETGRPIEMELTLDPYTGEWLEGTITDPAYYLWRKDNNSSHHFFVAVYSEFGHPEVELLETDLARFHDPEEIPKLLRESNARLRQLGLRAKRELQRQKRKANKRRIHDLVFEGKGLRRSAKVASYPGAPTRTSSAERAQIEKEAREDGWELPSGPANP